MTREQALEIAARELSDLAAFDYFANGDRSSDYAIAADIVKELLAESV